MTRKILTAVAALLMVSSLATGAAAGATDTVDADIIIDQPEFVDDGVEVNQTGDGPVHRVTGSSFDIWLTSANHSAIQRWGVSEGSGDIQYDEARDHWTFEPAGNGTMVLYWIEQSERQRTVQTGNGTEQQTETVTIRHEATIRVDDTSWVHRPAAEDRDLQRSADNWSALESEISREFPDRETDEVISSALSKEMFFGDAFDSYFADMQAVILMLVLRPGGLTLLGLFVGTSLLATYSGLRYKNRAQKQLREERQLEEEKRDVQIDKTKQIIQQCDYNDIFPDDTARALRELLGSNPWVGFKQYLQVRSPQKIKATMLQLMGQVGYEGRVERSADGEVVAAWVVTDEADDVATDGGGTTVESVDLTKLDDGKPDHRAIIDAIPGSDIDERIFDSPQDLDPQQVDLPIDNRDIEDAELLQELQPRFPDDFENEQHMAECLAELMAFVENHPHYTDADGDVREGMDLLSFMAEIDTVLADQADFPVATTLRKQLYWIADDMDVEGKLDEEMQTIADDGIGGD